MFVLLQTLSRRFVARFPQGEKAVGLEERVDRRWSARSPGRRPRAGRCRPHRPARPADPSPYHRLNPLTKAVIATVGSVGAFVLGGYVGPIAIIVVMLVLAGAAGVLGRLVARLAPADLPIAISVVLVSVFTRAGTTVLFEIGPFDATARGRRLRGPDARPAVRHLDCRSGCSC